jgi:F0F1-type ATP synthase membrane subunit c/vacuolar-type H+-ATPase subunit K
MNFEVTPTIIAALIGGLSGVGGAWIGGKIVSDTQKKIMEENAEKQRKSVAAAFYGEIYTILNLIQMRNYEKIFKNALYHIKKHKNHPVSDSFSK